MTIPRGNIVKLENHRFTVILVLLALIICGVIAGYFAFMTPAPKKMDLAAILKILNLDIYTAENEIEIPAAKPPLENGPPGNALVPPPPAGTTPAAKLPMAEFVHEKIKGVDTRAEFTSGMTAFRTVLPPAKLAPDMFVFSTLPFDAPVAEFPIVLVWQKNLEWTRTRTGDRSGGGPSGLAGGTIYGKTPPPPVTPPTPPGPPGPPEPPVPPTPPPEVSKSGL